MAIRYKGQEFSDEQAQVLFDELIGAKHDTSSTTPSVTPLNGPFPGNNAQYGIFSTPGGRPGVWNATPRMESISRYIPMFKSTILNELPEVATGVTASSGSNQTSACVVGPKPGVLKGARIVSTFGIIHISTKIFDVTQAGARVNRADITREFYNGAAIDNPWLPQVPGIDGLTNNATVMRSEMFALGVAAEAAINPVHFVGVRGTENNDYVGVARQWDGLDSLIKTGWTDSVSGQLAPALDANVQLFGAPSTGNNADGLNLVSALTDTYYGSWDQQRKLGIMPEYGLVMRPDMFRAIANVWACSYGTDRCYNAAVGTPITRSSTEVQANYERITQDMMLPLDGRNVPIILDDSIPRQTIGDDYYQSDIYGVMFRGNGIPTLFGEYFDMDNPEAMEIVNFMGSPDGTTTTVNNGLYRVFKRVTGGCVEFDFFARPRLLTTTPFAHFRLDNIFYRSYYRQTDARIGQSYYRNGGVTYRL